MSDGFNIDMSKVIFNAPNVMVEDIDGQARVLSLDTYSGKSAAVDELASEVLRLKKSIDHWRLTPQERKVFEEWGHTCGSSAGCIGGKISIEILPTTIGTFVKAKCICGEECDLSDLDTF